MARQLDAAMFFNYRFASTSLVQASRQSIDPYSLKKNMHWAAIMLYYLLRGIMVLYLVTLPNYHLLQICDHIIQ